MNIQAMWSLANSILRDSRALLSWQLKELDLTPSEASIILHLHVHGAARIQDRLAEELDVSKPAISKGSRRTRGERVRRTPARPG